MNNTILEDLNLNEFITFDVETTGLEAEFDSVIEFSAVLFKDGKVEDKLSFLCKPKGKISSDIELLTGISNAMVKDKASFDERIPEVIKFQHSFFEAIHAAIILTNCFVPLFFKVF